MTEVAERNDTDHAAANRDAIRAGMRRRASPWSLRQRLVRVVWQVVGGAAWALLPWCRAWLLRRFGARVGRGCSLGRGVDIVIPWNLRIGDRVTVADRAILYALGPLVIGDDVVIDYRAHLCAGSHDLADPRFPQTRPPIAIGDGTVIGIDAFIAPGVTLGRGCRVRARASVYRNFGDGIVLEGNPARAVPAGDGAT